MNKLKNRYILKSLEYEGIEINNITEEQLKMVLRKIEVCDKL